jgi:hypothetical protein
VPSLRCRSGSLRPAPIVSARQQANRRLPPDVSPHLCHTLLACSHTLGRCQAIVFPNGSTLKLNANQTTFVSEGTTPTGSMWSLIPMPPTLLGPCCIPGTNDTDSTPFHCNAGETGVDACKTACEPCPGTPGSDCSRCDQVNSVQPDRYKIGPPFPAPCDGCEGVDWSGYAVRDVVKIPQGLAAGK